MAQDVYGQLQVLCGNYHGKCTRGPWSAAAGAVLNNFIQYDKLDFFLEFYFKIPVGVSTVVSYAGKVEMLGQFFGNDVPGEFKLQGYEIRPRQKGYRDALSRQKRYEQGVKEHYENMQ
jgi:hypothetical protein